MKFISRCAAVLVLSLALAAHAADEVTVANAWARATPPGQKTASVYFDVTSREPAALVAASTPVAQRAELHRMSMENGIMRMRPVQRIELPAGRRVELSPSGLHLMLTGLKEPLKAGDRVPVTLTVEPSAGASFKVQADAEVRPLTASSGGMHHH